MLEFALPYVIALSLGMEPPAKAEAIAAAESAAAEAAMAAAATEAPEATEATEAASAAVGAASAERTPEPQIPSGKYTTAVEIKPILGMTKSSWVAVRLYEGQDLVYFTHLFSWRCGLWEIRYGVNGAPAETVVPMEPCHEDMATPNAMNDVANFLPYIVLPPESVETIYVEVDFDDGTTDFARFSRSEILIP